MSYVECAETIGIAWDKVSPNLKATMLEDFLKIKAGFPNAQIELLPPDGWVDSIDIPTMANLAELPIVQGTEPSVWRVYVVDEEVLLPDYAADVIRKELTPKESQGLQLVPNKDMYPVLERQSDMRIVPPGVSLTLNKMPPRQNKDMPYVLPENYWLSPFI